jgi:hypothetical protein
LTERCSSSSTAAEPGICLALCETDADCRLGETCWFDACVPSLTSVEPPESAATPDASDYFDVDTDVDFSQPVSLPTPELAIDGFADELVGEWSGRGEPLTAYSGPSDAGARLVISESAGAVVGEFHWEFGLIDGGSFPGPFAAARDPDVGYPTEVDAENYGGLRWPNPRIPYRLFDGALTAGRFTFWTSTLDLWSNWCSAQTPYPIDIDGRRAFRCVPESATESNTDPGKFKLCSSVGGGLCTKDNGDPVCGVSYCECSSSACAAALRNNTIVVDLELSGTTMKGVMTVGPDAWAMEFTREAP